MSAERMPHAEGSLLARPLERLTRLVLRFPVATIILAVLGAVAALALAVGRLEYRTSRIALINSDCAYNRLWLDYIAEFGDENDVLIVVEGSGRDQIVPVLEELGATLGREARLFHSVLHKIDLSRIRAKGLYYLPPEQLLGLDQFLTEVEPIVGGDWSRLNLCQMVGAMGAGLQAAGTPEGEAIRRAGQAGLAQLSSGMLCALGGTGQYRSPWPDMSAMAAAVGDLEPRYLLSVDGRLGFVVLRLTTQEQNEKGLAHASEPIDALRQLIAQARGRHPEVTIGLTGLPVMENDEMRISQFSMVEANVLSLIGVSVLFVAGFGGLRHPLLANLALMLGMAWAIGYLTLAVGHLNILTIAFGAILIGVGIDFGVHYVARYLQLHPTVRSSKESLIQTASTVGSGVVTGAMTTAIAFFSASLTDFTGIAELGVIAGGGILLCCVAAMTALPAMIYLSDARRSSQALPTPLDIHVFLAPMFRRPKTVVATTLVLTGLLALGMNRLWYDHNLLNLQAQGLESVELEQKLLRQQDQSVWFALSVAESLEDLAERKRRFEQLPSVRRVEDLSEFFPSAAQQKRPILERISQRLVQLPQQPPQIPISSPADVAAALSRAAALLSGSAEAAELQAQLQAICQGLAQTPAAEVYARLAGYQQQMAGDLLARLHMLRGVASPEPPALSDLPESLVTRFVGRNGKHLLRIYSSANIWNMDAMEEFVREVRSVDPRATGNPLQTYEASRQMKHSYEQAAWYSLAGILLVVYADFRSLSYTLLAMMPLGLSMLQLFGIMGFLGIPLNPANMIVLPLTLGVGVDNGVHIVHDFRHQSGRYRISPSTASAVVITSLTEMVGFGSLMISSHQGLQSLGRVLTLGMSCCLVTSLAILPALLAWISWNRAESESQSPHPEDASATEPIPPKPIYRRDPPEPGAQGLHGGRPVGRRHELERRSR